MFSNGPSLSATNALEITGKDTQQASIFRWFRPDTRYGQEPYLR